MKITFSFGTDLRLFHLSCMLHNTRPDLPSHTWIIIWSCQCSQRLVDLDKYVPAPWQVPVGWGKCFAVLCSAVFGTFGYPFLLMAS